MRRALPLAGLLLAWTLMLGAPSCPPPAPQPTPTPCVTCPAGQHCEGGACVADPPPPTPDPSPVCEPGATCGCWHRPPGEEWQQLPPCPPTPTCPATCPAGTACADPVAGCVPTPPEPPTGCSIDGEPGPELQGYRPQLGAQVNAAMTALSGCAAGSRCVVQEARQAWQARVVAELRRRGLCAGQHTPETDEIAAATSVTAPREGWHIYAGSDAGPGTVVWSPGASRPAYAAPVGPPPPVDPPPSTAGCSPPAVPKVARWGLTYRNRWWDCTPQFYGKDTATWTGVPVNGYCAAIGMSERLYCPARQEGDPNRRACEGVGLGGYAAAVPLWRCEQGVPEVNEANPFQARCAAGWVEVCATDGTSCTRGEP